MTASKKLGIPGQNKAKKKDATGKPVQSKDTKKPRKRKLEQIQTGPSPHPYMASPQMHPHDSCHDLLLQDGEPGESAIDDLYPEDGLLSQDGMLSQDGLLDEEPGDEVDENEVECADDISVDNVSDDEICAPAKISPHITTKMLSLPKKHQAAKPARHYPRGAMLQFEEDVDA